jgi:hypothetical protein
MSKEDPNAQIQSWARIQSGMSCGASGGARRHRPFDSNSLFVLRLNYAVVSSVLAALLFAASSAAQARMINAASPSLADVRKAIASAADGDTVIVPAGTAAWTSCLTITKGITIQGQTTVDSDNGAADDQTILVDNLVRVPGGQGFFHCKTNASQSLRITGITFTGTGGLTETAYNGAIRVGGTSHQVRLDHLHFTNLHHNNYVAIYGPIYGVSDHVLEDHLPSQNGQQKVFNGTGYGDAEFAQDAGYGGSKFFFFEDWFVNNTAGPFTASGGWDANIGGKFVIRHCHLYDVEILCHGTEGSRARGGRAQEIYNNDYHWSYLTTMDGIRSGTLIVHDNTYDGVKPQGYGLQAYRRIFGYDSIWKGAHGANAWDYNSTEADGSHSDGHPPYLFESGTVTSAVNTVPGTMTDNTKSWTTNRWTGYELRRLSDGATWLITGNNSHTLNINQWGDPCCIQNWSAGNTYEIHNALIVMDQPGLGPGDLLSGDNPSPRWLNQVREGCYSWNNIYTANGDHINWRPSSPGLLEGRDYFSDTPLPGYTPYTYPHPLTKGLASPEQMSRDATGNSQHNLRKKRQTWGGKKLDRRKAKKAKENPTNETADGQDNLGN